MPRWTFYVDEVSAGVFRVKGVDEVGRSVESKGTDPDSLLEDCKSSAARIQAGESDRSRSDGLPPSQ